MSSHECNLCPVVMLKPDCIHVDDFDDQRVGAFFNLPRTGTTVVTVGRTASGDTALGGAVSFFGFFTILLVC